MAQKNDRALFALFEELIKNTKLVEYYPYNKTNIFKKDDVVQVSYLKGFFKVLAIEDSYVTIKLINSTSNKLDMVAHVGPKFIKKVELNQQVMRILFNETD